MELQLGTLSLNDRTRQGDPPFSIYVHYNPRTLFIQLRNGSVRSVELKLSACADCTTFFVKDSHSLHRILKLTGKFQEFFSLKFCVNRCEACWIGGAKTSRSEPVRWKWTSLIKKCIPILGILISVTIKC